MKEYKYRVDIGGGATNGVVMVPDNATEEEIAYAVMIDLYDYEVEEIIYDKPDNLMRISKITMRYGNTVRVAVEKLPNDIVTDVLYYLDKNGYKPGDNYIPDGGVKDMFLEVIYDIDSDVASLVYYFDDYEVIEEYKGYEDITIMVKSFVVNNIDDIPDSKDYLLGDAEYLELEEVKKLNDKLFKY